MKTIYLTWFRKIKISNDAYEELKKQMLANQVSGYMFFEDCAINLKHILYIK